MSQADKVVVGILVALAVAFALVALSVHLLVNHDDPIPGQVHDADEATFTPGVAPLPPTKPVQFEPFPLYPTLQTFRPSDTKPMPRIKDDETRVGNGPRS